MKHLQHAAIVVFVMPLFLLGILLVGHELRKDLEE